MRLTPVTIENLKATQAEGQRSVSVPGFPRLSLRVNYGGKKSWCFRTKSKSRVIFGHWPDMGLAEAQETYREAIAAEGKGTCRLRPWS